jgi:hypothetical protein
LDVIGEGVTKLKEIALDMNQELDKQQDLLNTIDSKADKALDHVDNINVSMKKALDGVCLYVGFERWRGDSFKENSLCRLIILWSTVFSSASF